MDLPPGFTLSQAGGVTSVTCSSCGASCSEPHRPDVVLVEWARGHRCEMSDSADALANGG